MKYREEGAPTSWIGNIAGSQKCEEWCRNILSDGSLKNATAGRGWKFREHWNVRKFGIWQTYLPFP
jgi:hypothetical protein